MKRRAHFLCVSVMAITLLCCAAQTVRGDQNPDFAKANQDYGEGHFQKALDGYQTLIRSGRLSASLFYNAGNAWFRLGNFGEAILNYERALALDPRHPEATANLHLVRDEARALELRESRLGRYLKAGTSTQYSIVAFIAFWLTLYGTTRLFFVRRRSAATVGLIILSIAVLGGSIFAVYSLETGSNGRDLAIVTGKNIEARLATADNASSILALPPGSEIRILSQRGDWIYADLPNDLRGWIPASGAQLVRM